jgi:hypothetical protein
VSVLLGLSWFPVCGVGVGVGVRECRIGVGRRDVQGLVASGSPGLVGEMGALSLRVAERVSIEPSSLPKTSTKTIILPVSLACPVEETLLEPLSPKSTVSADLASMTSHTNHEHAY